MTIIDIQGPDDRCNLDKFFAVAAEVYKNDPVWVPESKAAFQQRYAMSKLKGNISIYPVIAMEDQLPAARAVAILPNGTVDKLGRPQGWIGFFEALPNNPHAALGVIKRCEEILAGAGARSVLAPKVDNQLAGLLVSGFHLPQTVLTNHNPPYYLGLLESQGYRKQYKTCTFYFTRDTVVQRQVKPDGFSTREFNRNNWPGELLIFNQMQNMIFAGQNGYIPRTLADDHEMLRDYLPYLDHELIIIAQTPAGDPVGLLICLPDLNQALKGREINRARIISIGVIPGLQGQGIGAAMGAHLADNLLRKGYQTAEAAWIMEHNMPPQKLAGWFNAQPGREFVLLDKNL
ncbi:MAG: hypothetical protein VR67_03040 [Peptococcaceae bacterium BRH_c8a]|nr:MAG: hypothetical protein VR67_03040 [Peptococcaceae bacterium BRH_c8a]